MCHMSLDAKLSVLSQPALLISLLQHGRTILMYVTITGASTLLRTDYKVSFL